MVMDWFDSFVKLAAEKELKKQNLSNDEESNGPEGVTVETDKDARRTVARAQSTVGEGVLSSE